MYVSLIAEPEGEATNLDAYCDIVLCGMMLSVSCLYVLCVGREEIENGWVLWFQRVKDRFVLLTFWSEYSDLFQGEGIVSVTVYQCCM